MADGGEYIPVPEMKRFVVDCFMAVGVSRTQSETMSDCIVGADSIGHNSHGVFRLSKFVTDVQNGNIDTHSSPKIEKETAATAWVNGQNSLGPIVGNYCIKLAIAKAKKVGAAIVVANNSNNFGVAGHYTMQALQEGLIGLAFSNSSSLMLPTRAKYPITGTNPISVAAPGIYDDFFLLDMATTVTSRGNIKIKHKNCEFLPDGWAANAACLPETNGDIAINTGRFLPLGSSEESGSYKGTGLSIMVDILCGVLAAAAYSDMVGAWLNNYIKRRANIGHCFIVIDPNFFAPDFEVRMNDFLSSIRYAEPHDPNKSVRVAGDKARKIQEVISEHGGLWYPDYVIEDLTKLSDSFKIKNVFCVPKPEPIRLTSSEEFAAFKEAEMRASGSIMHDEFSIISQRSSVVAIDNEEQKTVSFSIEDSSEWLCPISDEEQPNTEDSIEKKKRDTLSKKEKLSGFQRFSTPHREEIPMLLRLDEIMQTRY
ncbi:hypothetical protein WA026_004826 [Henosepilachna vigintioctopunctata]|uniref:Malate dehydrogenase n=1 Tax=Henosepilachna vigintioctopunctata TaxID=420089 RepID=A0AAW1URS5_9CUCU